MILENEYRNIRQTTEKLIQNLEPEDTVVQPMGDASPPKWHLAHTTWFFENFILKNYIQNYTSYSNYFDYLFNSYYESQGDRVLRVHRGFHPRPLLKDILQYRSYVDEKIISLFQTNKDPSFHELIELGTNHEEQHQELLLTDLKYIWSHSPLPLCYNHSQKNEPSTPANREWLKIESGLYEIGTSNTSFHFDNESPRHKQYLYSFEIASTPVTNGEFLEFIESNGYGSFQFWLQEGFHWIMEQKIQSPLYWKKESGKWYHFTLNGFCEVNLQEPITHISFYEADAFAKWKGMRLPTEGEWEIACDTFGSKDTTHNSLESGRFHPTIVKENDSAFIGQVWEWTYSAYLPYPNFKPWKGSVGEYNGKFMINQMVLKGGSCTTPFKHIRSTYRNFFHPSARWQFSGVRLARDES